VAVFMTWTALLTSVGRLWSLGGFGILSGKQPESVPMVYLKSFLFGMGGAVLAVILWFTVAFILPLYVPYLLARVRGTGGVSSGYVSSDSILIAALIGFITAFAWEWYRLRAA
jgi:hypothetical protein